MNNNIPTEFEDNSYEQGLYDGFAAGFRQAWLDNGVSPGTVNYYALGYNYGVQYAEENPSMVLSEGVEAVRLVDSRFIYVDNGSDGGQDLINYNRIMGGFRDGWYSVKVDEGYNAGYADGLSKGAGDAIYFHSEVYQNHTLEQALQYMGNDDYYYMTPDYVKEDDPYGYGKHFGLIEGFTNKFNELTA